MHESIPGVTIPPPRDTPGNLPDRQFTGVGNLPFMYVHGGRDCYSRQGPRGFDKWLPRIPPANFKAAKPGRAGRILRPRGQGGVKFIVRISENYNLCRANLSTTIEGL